MAGGAKVTTVRTVGPSAARKNTLDQQDNDDAQSIYENLEKEIIPLFYKRDSERIPVEWLQFVKESLRTVTPQFSLQRMLKEYMTDYYLPAIKEQKVE
jgi:glucan phosphorylase